MAEDTHPYSDKPDAELLNMTAQSLLATQALAALIVRLKNSLSAQHASTELLNRRLLCFTIVYTAAAIVQVGLVVWQIVLVLSKP